MRAVYSFKEFDKILRKNGYTLSRISGDHHIYVKAGYPTISIPRNHKGINCMMLGRIIKESNLITDKKMLKELTIND